MLSRRGMIAGAAGVGLAARGARGADAAFPSRTVRFVVGFPAGGAPDVAARIMAERLGAVWHQPVVVDNRPAGSGNLAAQMVAHGETDGHTLLFAHASLLLLNEVLMRDAGFDGERDFKPITLLMGTPFMVACGPALPVATLGALRDYARGRSSPVTFATVSATGLPRLVGEQLHNALGIELVNVPYSTMSGAVQDTIAGRVDLVIDGTPVITPQVRGGYLKALAVTSPARYPGIEDVPTAAETIPGFASKGWFGLMGPAALPDAVVRKVGADSATVLADPELRARLLRDFGAEVYPDSPAQFAAQLASERTLYRGLAREIGAAID